MILRLLGPQGIAGLVIAAALAILLLLEKGDTRHWRKQSGQFEQLYRAEQAALAGTVANYRAAAEAARVADLATINRVTVEQRAISRRTADDFQARIALARAAAQRLREQTDAAAADPGHSPTAPMPGLPAAPGSAAQAAAQDGLSQADRLTATEQAIQLDELIKWVKSQASVAADPGASR